MPGLHREGYLENRNVTSCQSISAPLNGEYGVSDLYLGVPAVINTSGIVKVIDHDLSEEESKKMAHLAAKMKEVLTA